MSPDSGSRLLLRRLRALMAEPLDDQTRLDRVVVLIANTMVAEVCSVYAVAAGGRLELFATEGLNPEAVHKTRLRMGEGLVGVIAASAEALNLSEARTHPDFAYRPETGEEAYHSFLGVPILHTGHTIGVLVVQNRTRRVYEDVEVEALETISMVIAEILAARGAVGAASSVERAVGEKHFEGVPIVAGFGIGLVVLHEPRVHVTNLISDNAADEMQRLETALGELRHSIDQMLERADFLHASEHREVIEAYRMFAHDRGWVGRMQEAVNAGLTAEAAVERVLNETRARLVRASNPYIKDRLHDLDDLANRLLRHLTGKVVTASQDEMPEDAIVFAHNIGPADLLDYAGRNLRGLVLEEGALNGHAAIVARALGIPFVGRVEDILTMVDDGDRVIVDGETGEVFLFPAEDVEHAYREKVKAAKRQQASYEKLSDLPAVSRDGIEVCLQLNAGLLVDLPHLERTGACGVGLFRTELQFMVASKLPRMSEQMDFYRAVFEAASPREVVFRTLDIGGDKALPYLHMDNEENPALGWRSMRMIDERPALLRMQVRALLRAAGRRELHLMFPFLTEVSEFVRARELVDLEVDLLRRHGHDIPQRIQTGALIEVPSILWQLDELMPLVDFVSVGSNDLHQHLFACDRTNPRLSGRYDMFSPVMLKTLRHIVQKATTYKVPLTLCGEMAGDPLGAMALLGLGFRTLSMAANCVGPVKAAIMRLDVGALETVVGAQIENMTQSLRPRLEAFARENGIPF